MKLLLILAVCALTSAQDAIVVDIPEHDAKIMADLYKQREAINVKIEAETERIGKKYATWESNNITASPSGKSSYPPFKFSSDFKHIVPDNARTFNPNTLQFNTYHSPATFANPI